jgi:polysaccharide export outer membrane protein
MSRSRAGLLAAWAALALAASSGCVHWTRLPAEPRQSPFVFKLGAGDRILVEVWKDETLTRELIVQPDGRITFPLAGTIEVAGKTLAEATGLVAERLRAKIREPVVTMTLLEFRSANFHVMGEVRAPGTYPYYEGDTVVSAVQRAGSFIPAYAAFWTIHLVRGPLDHPKVYEIGLDDVLDGRAEDVRIEPGDIVYVPPRWVTSFDRFVTQALSPLRVVTGAARDVAGQTTRVVAVPTPVP